MKIIVVGNGMVGYKFCEKLTSQSIKCQITVFAEETRPAYDRVHLSDLVNGKSPEELSMSSVEWYRERGITLHLADPVLHIDRCDQKVTSFSGIEAYYDYLVLATGSAPFVPSIQGVEKDGVFVYRTIEDIEQLTSYAKKAQIGAVIGGGLLGLEAAKALLDLGLEEIHVIESAPRLMPRQIDDRGSQMLKSKLESMRIRVHTNKVTNRIIGNECISGVQFADGSELFLQMLIISAGIKPRDELAVKAGLSVGAKGGIIVNEKMQTSDKNIFAIGECALYEGMIYGLVAPGYEMAEVAVAQLTQANKRFSYYDMSTKLKLVGVDVASFGNPFACEPECKTLILEDKNKGIYKRINISADGKYLIGGILVGEAKDYNMLLQITKNKILLPPNPEDLILGTGGEGKENSATKITDLPEEAIVCSCESVNKGSICNAIIAQNIESIEQVKKCTKAGTGCGGCTPLLQELLTATMKTQGKYVRNVLCEHFQYSRQEILDLIKLKGFRTYDEVLDTIGKGDGCEICKPAIASILASLWNEMILKQDTIQDTNDRFLANIQKGGTYSVVPRIPGGEISPDKLIVIGQIAKKYGLYTKITGGQRIDLFGAHLSDLPLIWEELIAAGFESGHAYGKAMRTVKSCIGSTWCRFGVQDSVSFAIRIEERYKGIRAPHKLKSAVSGCIRECAEAQSKDFGIIATEKGWNLYVCGNGGTKPQHALLLASDLDEETCIRYIDRFLMFYIKTADPLTRTATWLNKMEGGINYLRNVVVNDSLGMAAQWEAEMQQLVNTFKCEWKEAINDPQIRKRFCHFVNAPMEKDPTVEFVPLRNQVKAKDWK
ncbi:nitrite reductase large subunit NirB [Thermoflexibacter ruber]|uniref:Assimilatory nitrite reductase (NAD(P)H) large subunit n=1 Tax=Thermoflexibacter ruber TaxID=1003 RepID=A0A1I2BIS9_9BACT|nr:nitrite reductase large subunit NirB [Thermoflexibacter ruber]SFE55969.1 assimilatory nitrite reductase (NAD(P)H) large subunit precursor [Thermoflexibacter ruber]